MKSLDKRKIIYYLLFSYAICSYAICLAELFVFLSLVVLIIILKEIKFDFNTKLFFYFVIFIFVVRIITAIFSINPGLSIIKIKEPFWLLLFFPVFLIATDEQKDFLVRVLIISMALITLFSIFRHFIIYHNPIDIKHRLTPSSSYMTYGSLVSMILILNLAVILKEKLKILFYVTFIILLAGLILSMTRSAWIGFFIGGGILLFFKARKWLLFLILFLVIIFLFLPHNFKSRFTSIFSVKYSTNKSRIEMWKWGIRQFKKRPITGIGPNTVKYLKKIDSTGLSDKSYKQMCHPHSVPVQMLTTMGFLGIIAYLFFVFVLIKIPLSDYLKTRNIMSVGILTAVISMIIIGFFECNLFDSEVTMLVSFVLGLTQRDIRG